MERLQVLTEREEKNSVAIASNESFSSWTKTFTDPRLCAAIVDRLTFGGNIIETGSDSSPTPKPANRPPPALDCTCSAGTRIRWLSAPEM